MEAFEAVEWEVVTIDVDDIITNSGDINMPFVGP